MQSALRADALTSTATGVALRIGLPWIRSLPIACVREPVVSIDGVDAAPLRITVGGRHLDPSQLADESGWWFAQDRLVLEVDEPLAPGIHSVAVSFRLFIPYLMAGPGGGALELPMHLAGDLLLDHDAVPSVSLDVA